MSKAMFSFFIFKALKGHQCIFICRKNELMRCNCLLKSEFFSLLLKILKNNNVIEIIAFFSIFSISLLSIQKEI